MATISTRCIEYHFAQEIRKGPGKYDLMVSFFSSTAREALYAELTLKDGETTKFLPYALTRVTLPEYGDDDGWEFDGFVHFGELMMSCRGEYSTKVRRGWIWYGLGSDEAEDEELYSKYSTAHPQAVHQ